MGNRAHGGSELAQRPLVADWGSLEEEAPLHPAPKSLPLPRSVLCPGLSREAYCRLRGQERDPRPPPGQSLSTHQHQRVSRTSRPGPGSGHRGRTGHLSPTPVLSAAHPQPHCSASLLGTWPPGALGKASQPQEGPPSAGNGPLCSPMSWCVLRCRDVGVLGLPCLGS